MHLVQSVMAQSMALSPTRFPPLSDVLKSRDVEDPVNLWVHRPLAYAFCRLVHRTSITPNHVTLLAMGLGLAASACWIEGSPRAMVWGGVLLWTSAIMDGADGILARAKNMQSAFGRALDGTADMVVGLASVAACVFHLYQQGISLSLMLLAAATVVTTALQLNLYDFYKELHMRMTRLGRGGEGDTSREAERLRNSDSVQKGPWYRRVSMDIYVSYLRFQERLIGATNPLALELRKHAAKSRESVESYREMNRGPMRLWMSVSLAPHAYLFALFGACDRLDLYVWLRATLMSLLTVAALVSQAKATRRTTYVFQSRGWA